MKWLGEKPTVGLALSRIGLGGVFRRVREITCVNLVITTRCNLSCPNCCCDIPGRKQRWDADMEYLERAAECFRGIDRLQLTGGEPSLHPQFQVIVPRMRDLFRCKSLTIESNGVRFRQIPMIFEQFDAIYATHYAPPEFEKDNGEEIRFLRDYLRPKGITVHSFDIQHIPRLARNDQPCFRGFSVTVACYLGKIYPCCVGWGVEDARSVPMEPGWRDALPSVQLPCSTCRFAQGKVPQRFSSWCGYFFKRPRG